jgi:hypothetical protein
VAEFELPAGWNTMKCQPAVYPEFSEPACRCLGDVSPWHSWQILDKVIGTNLDKVIAYFHYELIVTLGKGLPK